MTRRFKRLGNDESGVAAMEMALSTPVLVVLFFAIFQLALILWAQASLSNAVGEAARYATIYPSPTDDQIIAYMENSQLGIDQTNIDSVTVARGNDNGRDFSDISVQYSVATSLIFFDGPAISLNQTRRAYQQ